jgi:hypothetical protein
MPLRWPPFGGCCADGGLSLPNPTRGRKVRGPQFAARLPNQCWQADASQWHLADGSEVEICNMVDDYSRVVTASRVFPVATARAVVEVFRVTSETWWLPASVLTNSCESNPDRTLTRGNHR